MLTQRAANGSRTASYSGRLRPFPAAPPLGEAFRGMMLNGQCRMGQESEIYLHTLTTQPTQLNAWTISVGPSRHSHESLLLLHASADQLLGSLVNIGHCRWRRELL